MATVVALDASPANVLRALRGTIVAARVAYPEVLHVEVRDSRGDLWRLATQDASWSPSDPAALIGRSIEEAAIDGTTGELRLGLSDGSALAIEPARADALDDPPSWEMVSPNGIALEFGPGMRWRISGADVPAPTPRQ